MHPEDSFEYITKLRELLSSRNYTAAMEFRDEYKKSLWDRLDPAAKQYFGQQEDLHVLVQTIRDYSLDEAEPNLEEPIQIEKSTAND